jgi:hypothetical protein
LRINALTVAVGVGLLLPLLPQGVRADTNTSKLTVRVTIGSFSINPNLNLTLGVDKSAALPGDLLSYSGQVTHAGITACLPGTFSAQHTGPATATIADFFDEIDEWDPNQLKWVPLVGVGIGSCACGWPNGGRISCRAFRQDHRAPANRRDYERWPYQRGCRDHSYLFARPEEQWRSIASKLAVNDALPGGATGTVSGVPSTLAAGASATAQASYAIPANRHRRHDVCPNIGTPTSVRLRPLFCTLPWRRPCG